MPTEFIHALRDASKISATVKLALELTILTSLRTAEVLYAKWNEIDFNGKMWTIPATRGKEPGMKKKREHRVPLSARCVEILQEAPELAKPFAPLYGVEASFVLVSAPPAAGWVVALPQR